MACGSPARSRAVALEPASSAGATHSWIDVLKDHCATFSARTAPLACPETVGLPVGARVLTSDGELPVEVLGSGDNIITLRGERTLTAVVCHRLSADAEHVSVSAAAFGGQATRDLILMPRQRVLLRGWRAQLYQGTNTAVPHIADVMDGDFIRLERGASKILISLHFDQVEIIHCEGLALASADRLEAVATKAKIA